MQKKVLILFLLILSLLPIMFASSVNNEMQKITHYAEEYETGNINYVQLQVYIASARESLNEVLGATGREIGGIVKQEQIRKILGEPNEETKWVWVEGQERDVRLDDYIPIWRKIIFDGKKIQIRLEAFPSIFMKKEIWEEFENKKFEDDEERQKFKEEQFNNFHEREFTSEDIIYKLHFGIEFKKPAEQLNIQGKINEIQSLAEVFNTNPSSSNAESLAKQSVNAERIFENYFKQNQGKCEDLMKSIFGSENQRESQKILLNEISFFESDDVEAIMRLEMCDECEWNWIHLDMHIDSRGRFKYPEDIKDPDEKESMERFKQMDSNGFKSEVGELISEIMRFLEMKDYGPALNYVHRLRMLNDAWNEQSNDVWEQIDKEYGEGDDMTMEEIEAFKDSQAKLEEKDPYYWIKREQEKRQRVNDLREQNYEERKQFYLSLFSHYDKKEYYFVQTEFEKRLVEEFKEFGEEICNNNQDDNENGNIDCDDEQCGGKICGKGTGFVQNGNGTTEVEVDFYCISGICQAREEIIVPTEPVCGNHICEAGEESCTPSLISCDDVSECAATSDCGSIYCPEDCVMCLEHEPVECFGKLIFSGEDEKGCPLPPICIGEERCFSNNDCNFLCGEGKCVFEHEEEQGKCKVTELRECNQTMCNDGEQQIMNCESGEEVVTAICDNGLWVNTEVKCSSGGESCEKECIDFASVSTPSCEGEANLKISGTYPNCECEWECEDIVGDECIMASDCGGEHDVCSNGKCVTIPEKRDITCPDIPISNWCPGEEELCPMKTNEQGCSEWDCGSCEESEEEIVEEEVNEDSEENVFEEEQEEPEQEEVQEEQEEVVDEENEPETEVTGGIIFNFFRAIAGRVTGSTIDEVVVDEVVVEDIPEDIPDEDDGFESKDCPDAGEPPETEDNCWHKTIYDEQGCVSGYDVECGEFEEDRDYDDEKEDWERKDSDEREQNEVEHRENCERECSRSCIDNCIRESCGQEMNCNIDEESKECEGECKADDNCIEKCMSGEPDWWKEFEGQYEHQIEKGVFQVGGGCRTSQGKTDGFIWFGGWGEPFNQIEPLKHQFYQGGEADWCKHDIENLIKQRTEFENGFNQEFAKWFFEDYLANSAENWEQAQSGIFELYWSNVDNQMQLAHRMQCLGIKDITEITNVNLINIEYETEFGSLEYWEEINSVYMPEIDEKVTIISPYMKIWVFPNKKFFEYEMKTSMENNEFPGPPEDKIERKNEEGPTAEEKEMIKQNKRFMQEIRKVSEIYGGNVDTVVQLKNFETGEIVFNLYVQINEEDIIKIKPMLPEEVPEEDVRIEIDFEKIYDLIYSMEKEMQGEFVESPPWDRQSKSGQKIKEITNGIKMYFKMREIINSAKVYPVEAEKTAKSLFKTFVSMMNEKEGDRDDFEEEERDKGEEKEIWESKEKITGEVIG